jgi:hypothetical protein
MGFRLLLIACLGAMAAAAYAQYQKGQPPKNASPMKDAELAQKVVQEKEADVLKVLREISEATQGSQPWDMVKERQALDGFKKLIPLLKERSGWLLSKHEEFVKNMNLYQAALAKAPSTLLRSSEAYTKYAAEEDEIFFKEQYLDMAARSKKLAAVMEARANTIKEVQADVAQKLRFVERSVVFLNRLEEFLTIYDPANDKSAEVDAYLKQLDAYIVHFNKSITAFKQLSDKIQSSTTSPGSRQP